MNESNLPNEQILFIKKIKKLRELNTWTIKELAKISGVSSGYISDIEAGLNKSIGKNILLLFIKGDNSGIILSNLLIIISA